MDGNENRRTATQLSQLMQRRLEFLQNPPSCSQARKAVCKVAKPCGFACQMHHLAYCFILAYASERTLVLEPRGWKYSPQGWEPVFQPLSQCNVSSGSQSVVQLTNIPGYDLLLQIVSSVVLRAVHVVFDVAVICNVGYSHCPCTAVSGWLTVPQCMSPVPQSTSSLTPCSTYGTFRGKSAGSYQRYHFAICRDPESSCSSVTHGSPTGHGLTAGLLPWLSLCLVYCTVPEIHYETLTRAQGLPGCKEE